MEQSMYTQYLTQMEKVLMTDKYSPEGWEFNYEIQSGCCYFHHNQGYVYVYATLGFESYKPDSGIPLSGWYNGIQVLEGMISDFTMEMLTGDVTKDCIAYVDVITRSLVHTLAIKMYRTGEPVIKIKEVDVPLKQYTVYVEGFVTFTAPEGIDIEDIPMKLDVTDNTEDEESPVTEVHETYITNKQISSETKV